MIQTLEKLKTFIASVHGEDDDRNKSYVQLAIAVLTEIGRPTPITVLLERIRERRNDPMVHINRSHDSFPPSSR